MGGRVVSRLAGRCIALVSPTVAKVAQILSARHDLLPRPVIGALQAIQDDCFPIGEWRVRRLLRAHFGRDVGDLELLGSGSVATVYGFTDLGGERVAVKVTRAGISWRLAADAAVIRGIANVIGLGTGTRAALISSSLRCVADLLPPQADMRLEAESLRQLRSGTDWPALAYVTTVGVSTRRLLFMKWADGSAWQTTDAHPGRLAEGLANAVLAMIFESGAVHLDLHAGNLLIHNQQVTAVDAGLMLRLSERQMQILSKFFIGLGLCNPARCAESLFDSAVQVGDGFNWVRFEADVEAIVDRFGQRVAGEFDLIGFCRELLSAEIRNELVPDPAIQMTFTSLFAIELRLRKHAPDLDFFAAAMKCIARAVFVPQ